MLIIIIHIISLVSLSQRDILKFYMIQEKLIRYKIYIKLDIENPIIRINTAFKGCSSLEKISVLPRIYHN